MQPRSRRHHLCECNCFVAYLLLGMVGFVVFWSILMLRIYLPEKYWRWSYIWDEDPGLSTATPGATATTANAREV